MKTYEEKYQNSVLLGRWFRKSIQYSFYPHSGLKFDAFSFQKVKLTDEE